MEHPMRMLRIALFCSVFLLLQTGVAGEGLAQQATPAPVSPALCRVDSLDSDRVLAFAGTPTAEQSEALAATSVAELLAGSPTPVVVAEAETSDAETVDVVTAAVYEWVACRNTGELALLFAMHTDDFLSAYLERSGPIPPQFLEPPVEPMAPVLQAAVFEMRSINTLDDDRVAVQIVLIDPLSAGVSSEAVMSGAQPARPLNEMTVEELQVSVLLILKEVDDGLWLVDGLQYGDQPYIGTPLTKE